MLCYCGFLLYIVEGMYVMHICVNSWPMIFTSLGNLHLFITFGFMIENNFGGGVCA